MFKPTLGRIAVFIASLFVVVYFQNCVPPSEGESVLESINNADEFRQIHQDNDHSSEIPIEEKNGIEVSKSLLDRAMIYSLFIDIFGPAAASLTELNQLRAERAVFGGPCSMYENFKSVRAGLRIDPDAENCANSETANNLSAPLIPLANVLQQALVNNVCQQIVTKSALYNYAIAQINENSSATPPQNSEENILKLFRLFYRGKPDPEMGLINSLQILVGEPASHEGWKLAITTTCVSSHWQAL